MMELYSYYQIRAQENYFQAQQKWIQAIINVETCCGSSLLDLAEQTCQLPYFKGCRKFDIHQQKEELRSSLS